jgi:hypothetical protein
MEDAVKGIREVRVTVRHVVTMIILKVAVMFTMRTQRRQTQRRQTRRRRMKARREGSHDRKEASQRSVIFLGI